MSDGVKFNVAAARAPYRVGSSLNMIVLGRRFPAGCDTEQISCGKQFLQYANVIKIVPHEYMLVLQICSTVFRHCNVS